MIFTELRFIILFAACWLCFALLPRKWRASVLAFWGVLFYLVYAGRFLAVVLVLCLLTFLSGTRSVMAWLTGLGVAGLLLYFKVAVVTAPLPLASSTSAVLVPLGFSYLTFELLHVLIERRRGRLRELSVPNLLAFVFFAPARISGPIKRYPQFVRAVEEAVISAENVYAGLMRVLIGLAKKFILADVLALTVAEHSYAASMSHVWVIILAYSLQIYFDFSAYSDIAIGFARMMGIALPENFRLPYLAPNIREFWDRWHITLSHWVRDYVFTTTGRRLFQTALRPWPAAIAAISYLVTFSIVGAWHGLTWAFLAWGLYHGALLTLYHLVRLKMPHWVTEHPLYRSRLAGMLSVALTFALVTVGWVPFLLPIDQARKMLTLMFGGGG